ncbi:unnamed protein product [Malus baccata var. baccata]
MSSHKRQVYEAAGIVKIDWVPSEYDDAVACFCHIPVRAPTASRARLRRSTILSVLSPDHALIVLFMKTHASRTSQWVTHPRIALARTRLISEF